MPLSEVRARLAHAEAHRQRLARAVDAFLATDPYEVVAEFDQKTGTRHLIFHVRSEPPPDLGLVLADLLGAARSSLDHLVYELAVISGSDPDAPGVRTQFPIYEDRRRYRASRDANLAGVDERFRRIIDAVQPHQRGQVMGKRDPLAQLAWMVNRDKHRKPLARFVQGVSEASAVRRMDLRAIHETAVDVPVQRGRALHDGDVMVSIRAATPFDVYLYPKPTVEIAFGKPELTVERIGFVLAYIGREVVGPVEQIV